MEFFDSRELTMPYVYGVDVSGYQPFIEWRKVRGAGIRFAIIKATEGIEYLNPKFDEQWQGAHSVGILRGAYHYLRASVDGLKQANYFLSKVKMQESDFPAFLDVEGANNIKATNLDFINNTYKWLQRVEQVTGRRPVIYSSVGFLSSRMLVNGKPPAWSKKYRTWLAQYYNSHTAAGKKPAENPDWGEWLFWQYSGGLRAVDGIYHDEGRQQLAKIDMNVFRSSLVELYGFAGVKPSSLDLIPSVPKSETEPSAETQPSMYKVKTGDTLHSIAASNQVNLDDLIKMNPQLICDGMQINLPDPIEAPQPAPPPPSMPALGIKHAVQAGDTLSSIASKYEVTVDSIVKENKIANPDFIGVGQVLQIPPM
jgi:lysozyme